MAAAPAPLVDASADESPMAAAPAPLVDESPMAVALAPPVDASADESPMTAALAPMVDERAHETPAALAPSVDTREDAAGEEAPSLEALVKDSSDEARPSSLDDTPGDAPSLEALASAESDHTNVEDEGLDGLVVVGVAQPSAVDDGQTNPDGVEAPALPEFAPEDDIVLLGDSWANAFESEVPVAAEDPSSLVHAPTEIGPPPSAVVSSETPELELVSNEPLPLQPPPSLLPRVRLSSSSRRLPVSLPAAPQARVRMAIAAEDSASAISLPTDRAGKIWMLLACAGLVAGALVYAFGVF